MQGVFVCVCVPLCVLHIQSSEVFFLTIQQNRPQQCRANKVEFPFAFVCLLVTDHTSQVSSQCCRQGVLFSTNEVYSSFWNGVLACIALYFDLGNLIKALAYVSRTCTLIFASWQQSYQGAKVVSPKTLNPRWLISLIVRRTVYHLRQYYAMDC